MLKIVFNVRQCMLNLIDNVNGMSLTKEDQEQLLFNGNCYISLILIVNFYLSL